MAVALLLCVCASGGGSNRLSSNKEEQHLKPEVQSQPAGTEDVDVDRYGWLDICTCLQGTKLSGCFVKLYSQILDKTTWQ